MGSENHRIDDQEIKARLNSNSAEFQMPDESFFWYQLQLSKQSDNLPAGEYEAFFQPHKMYKYGPLIEWAGKLTLYHQESGKRLKQCQVEPMVSMDIFFERLKATKRIRIRWSGKVFKVLDIKNSKERGAQNQDSRLST